MSGSCEELTNACELAVKALKKQVPEHVFDEYYRVDGKHFGRCPHCKSREWIESFKFAYCHTCGQKLDWSKED